MTQLAAKSTAKKRPMISSDEAVFTRAFNVIIERDGEGYYVASVPELPGCHTQAKSLDTLMKRIREAIELCLEVQDLTDVAQHEFVGVQRILVAV